MLCLKSAKRTAFTLNVTRSVRFYGARSTTKCQSIKARSLRLAGAFLGVGCAIATGVSISLAFGEGEDDNLVCENDIGGQGSNSIKENQRKHHLKEAVKASILKLEQVKEETGSPGLVCAVSVDGEVVMSTGLGFADVENGVKCHDGTMMRIASISKALTSVAVGKLLQEGKIDLNAPVQHYVDYFPLKEYNGEMAAITMKHLMSHTSGIRHYEKMLKDKEAELNGGNKQVELRKDEEKSSEALNEVVKEVDVHSEAVIKSGKDPKGQNNEKIIPGKEKDVKPKIEGSQNNEFQLKEYYISKHYDTVKEAVAIFKDDPLLKMPGSDYLYTTHGWTLLSACIEGASGKDYVAYMKEMCYDLGLDNTIVELNDPIVYNRSKYYKRDSKGKLRNTPYVNNSYKWAGGGFLSTVKDLVKLGNIVLYSFQCANATLWKKKGYLRKDIVERFWTPEQATMGKVSKKRKETAFGLGWQLLSGTSSYGCCRETKFAAYHTGGAVGASSVLLIVPSDSSEENCNAVKSTKETKETKEKMLYGSSREKEQHELSVAKNANRCKEELKPRGIVVAIIVNMQEVGLVDTALNIAENFTFEL